MHTVWSVHAFAGVCDNLRFVRTSYRTTGGHIYMVFRRCAFVHVSSHWLIVGIFSNRIYMYADILPYGWACVGAIDPFVCNFCRIAHTYDFVHLYEWADDVSNGLLCGNLCHNIHKRVNVVPSDFAEGMKCVWKFCCLSIFSQFIAYRSHVRIVSRLAIGVHSMFLTHMNA